MRTPLLVLMAIATTATAAAQWVNHPTPNLPRLSDGRVNANALAPKAADGRPDFSGLWTGANTLTDPACAAKPGCIPQEPLPFTVRLDQTIVVDTELLDSKLHGERTVGASHGRRVSGGPAKAGLQILASEGDV